MMSLTEALARAATLMADLGFPYAVIGGAAVVARARPLGLDLEHRSG